MIFPFQYFSISNAIQALHLKLLSERKRAEQTSAQGHTSHFLKDAARIEEASEQKIESSSRIYYAITIKIASSTPVIRFLLLASSIQCRSLMWSISILQCHSEQVFSLDTH